MADNTPTTSGDVIATDDLTTLNGGAVSGVKAQRVKVGYGSDGSFRDVDLSNGLPVIGVQDARTTGTITSAASVAGPVAISNRNVVTVDVSGTYAGVTFIAEASPDGGTTYYPIQGVNNATGQAGNTWTPGTNASASYDFAVGGFTNFRIRATAWTSGTATVGISMQTFAYDPAIATIAQGPAAAGAAIVGNPVLVGGSDGTNARALAMDTSGRPVVVLAPATSVAVTQSTANTAVTLTIAAAGAGLFHYITSIQIRRANTSAAAVAGSASNLAYTSTNIPGSFAVHTGNAIAAGVTIIDFDRSFTQPLKTTTANTATTIVCPAAGAGVQCEVIVTYYTAP